MTENTTTAATAATQPEALRLAHLFDQPLPPDWCDMVAAAAELRRLHALTAAPAAQEAEPVGEAGTMPGTSGFTMACFHADKVPVGTKLYAAPQAPAAAVAPAEPLQDFDSPRAQALMRAWEEGWEACRDADFVGEEAQNDAFNRSETVNRCIAEDMALTATAAAPTQEADAARLDYLQRGSTVELLPGRHAPYPMLFRIGGLWQTEYADIRAAIDAARARQEGGGA